MLNISIPTLRELERKGRIQPVPVAQAHGFKRPVGPGRMPKVVLRAEDVARLREDEHVRRLNDGEVSAEAMKLFVAGKGVIDVVIALRVTPARASELFEAYRANIGGLVVPEKILDDLRQLGFVAIDATNFVPTVERLLTTVRELRRASKAAA